MTANTLCIFHAECDDGFAAALVVRNALRAEGVDFFPGIYQKPPPDVAGRHVILVDFSYKRSVLDAMALEAKSLLVIDHHKTAQADLASVHQLSPRAFYQGWLNCREQHPYACLFDMERSGAGMAWDFFNTQANRGGAHTPWPRPAFIDYVEDRDLWRKKLPGGDLFSIALRSYPQNFDVWDTLVMNGPERLIVEGEPIWRYYNATCGKIMDEAYICHLAAHACWIVNSPRFAASEVAGGLAERALIFGASYYRRGDGLWEYSLRSRTDFDVSEIAKKFGGGGHAKAAGFTSSHLIHERMQT